MDNAPRNPGYRPTATEDLPPPDYTFGGVGVQAEEEDGATAPTPADKTPFQKEGLILPPLDCVLQTTANASWERPTSLGDFPTPSKSKPSILFSRPQCSIFGTVPLCRG